LLIRQKCTPTAIFPTGKTQVLGILYIQYISSYVNLETIRKVIHGLLQQYHTTKHVRHS